VQVDRAKFRAPKNTQHVLPPDSARWAVLEQEFTARADRFGYQRLITPLFEHLEVFTRLGADTDVVSKEMYEFTDKGGRQLALRPEGTASVVRAFVQHRPSVPWKVWYSAPNFRYERGQKGRYRQHWQFGAEALGSDDPDLDVELIDLAHGYYRTLGLTDFRLAINSMGDLESRDDFRDALRTYFREHGAGLGPEFLRRAEENPIRLLDTKDDAWREVVERAPQLFDHLTDPARRRFERVQQGLQELGVPFELDHSLVRGFDYYTETVFEFASGALDAAQNAIGGGGRYDRLAEEMGGPPTPGIGFGIGVERLLLACDAEGIVPTPVRPPDVLVLDQTDVDVADGRALVLTHELREAGFRADRLYGQQSEKAQWKRVSAIGPRFTVVVQPGDDVLVSEHGARDKTPYPFDTAFEVLLSKLSESP